MKKRIDAKIKCLLKQRTLIILLIISGYLLAFTSSVKALSLWVGQSYTCDVSSSVMGLTSDVSWSTSGGYISLSGSGFYRSVTATQYWSGTATVKCTWKYRLYSGDSWKTQSRSWSFTCNENPLSIYPSEMELSIGDIDYIRYSHTYNNQYSSSANVSFSSTNPNVATVTTSGKVVAVSSGTCYINVYSNLSSAAKAPACRITVRNVYPTSVSLPSTKTLYIGESEKLTPVLSPSSASTTYSWYSSNTYIAKVSTDGVVTGRSAGTANITVETHNGKTAQCEVTVKKRKLSLSANPEGGTYNYGSQIVLNASYPDAHIYYTTDGTLPSNKSKLYSQPISLLENMTLKAITVGDNYIDSEVMSYTYKIPDLCNIGGNINDRQTDVGRTVHPLITFNTPIKKSINFEKITLTDNNGNVINGRSFIQGTDYIFVPDEYLNSRTNYTLKIPENAVTDEDSNENLEYTVHFTTVGHGGNNYVQIGNGFYVLDDGSLWILGGSYNPLAGVWGEETTQILSNVRNFYKKGRYYYQTKDNELWGWGESSTELYGSDLLGDGYSIKRKSPVFIAKDVEKYEIWWHNVILKTDKSLWTWGRNACGQIGDGTHGQSQYALSPHKVMVGVRDFSIADRGTAAIKEDGSLWVWGWFAEGNYSPKKILDNVKSVVCDNGYLLALKTDGTVWAYGNNKEGQLGDGTTTERNSPVRIMNNVSKIFANGDHSAALKTDGTLWVWGDGRYNGGIGLGEGVSSLVPKKLMEDVKDVRLDNSAGYILKNDSCVWGWGIYYYDNESRKEAYTPIKLFDDVNEFFSDYSIYVVKSDGSVWRWYNKAELIVPAQKLSAYESINMPLILTISKDEELPIQFDLYPTAVDLTKLSITSNNESVATVTNTGIVKGISEGEAQIIIRGTNEDGNHIEVRCNVVCINTTSVNDVSHSSISLKYDGATLQLDGLNNNEVVSVYNIAGQLVNKGVAAYGRIQLNIEEYNGIIIVKTGNKTYKVKI